MIYCSRQVSIWAKSGFSGRLLLLPLAGGSKDAKRFDADWRLISSLQAQIILKGIRRNETATIKTVRKKPLRHWCGWGDLVEGSFVKQNVLQRRVSKLLNEPPYGRQNQTNRRYMFRKTSAMRVLEYAEIRTVLQSRISREIPRRHSSNSRVY